MPYWEPLRVGLELYDISHLEPFSFEIRPTGWDETALVAVKFHDHCFTESFTLQKHSHVVRSNNSSQHERRGSSPDRYELSRRLPALVRSLDGKRISQTRSGGLVRIDLADGRNYGIFFTIRRNDPKNCDLFVMSAYPFNADRRAIAVTGEMKFNVAVARVLAGKRPKFPPRN